MFLCELETLLRQTMRLSFFTHFSQGHSLV